VARAAAPPAAAIPPPPATRGPTPARADAANRTAPPPMMPKLLTPGQSFLQVENGGIRRKSGQLSSSARRSL